MVVCCILLYVCVLVCSVMLGSSLFIAVLFIAVPLVLPLAGEVPNFPLRKIHENFASKRGPPRQRPSAQLCETIALLQVLQFSPSELAHSFIGSGE